MQDEKINFKDILDTAQELSMDATEEDLKAWFQHYSFKGEGQYVVEADWARALDGADAEGVLKSVGIDLSGEREGIRHSLDVIAAVSSVS